MRKSIHSGSGLIVAALMLGQCLTASGPAVGQVQVPAYTGYVEPDPGGAEVSPDGITHWKQGNRIVWAGLLRKSGALTVAVTVRAPVGQSGKLTLSVGSTRRSAVYSGIGAPIDLDFGSFNISKVGYERFTLTPARLGLTPLPDIISVNLSGPATVDCNFNMVERRNAASVHLIYPLDDNRDVSAFYNEVTVREAPLWSYFMACGFKRGYFGIQVNSPTERRIIFSVWDSGTEAVDRGRVGEADRVKLMAKGEGVTAGDFGNEGTGGHSHMIYPWKIGVTYRFLVTSRADGTHTTYSGYFYFPESRKWELISSFRAPKDGNLLSGLYSFNENFGGDNGELRRLAEFGRQWVYSGKQWHELTAAKFSHDATGRRDRLDYASGVVHGRFFLSNGGFVANGVKYGDMMHREAGSQLPSDIPDSLLP